MSRVTSHLSHFLFFIFYKTVKLVSGGSVINWATPTSLINWLSESSFVEISSENLHSQTGSARERQFWEKVHLPPPVIFHMSCVMCHSSHVIFLQSVEMSGGGSVINGASPSNCLKSEILLYTKTCHVWNPPPKKKTKTFDTWLKTFSFYLGNWRKNLLDWKFYSCSNIKVHWGDRRYIHIYHNILTESA